MNQLIAVGPPVGGNCTTRGSVITPREGSHGRQTGELHYTGSDTPATRRQKASCSAKPPSQPARSAPRRLQGLAQHRLARKTSPNTAPPAALPRKNSPGTAPPAALPRQNSPSTHKTPISGHFERAGRTFSRFHDLTATQGELFRARRRRPSGALPLSTPGPTGVEGAGGCGGTGGPGCGAGCGRLAGPAWVGGANARQISHIISHGHFSRPPENVAIPTN